jgi:hypothetical protein
MPYIFLDESGQFNKHNNENYFVVGSFTVGNQRRTQKAFTSWQRTKFPRKLRHQQEIKFSEVNIGDDLRLKTLKHIANLDVRIHYIYLLKENIPEEYRMGDSLQSGRLYTNVIGEILEMYLPTTDAEFRVFCDERNLKGIKRADFKNMIKSRLLPQLPKGAVVQIEMVDSKKNSNIQIADWISGSLAWYLEDKRMGKECFQILKNNLLLQDGKELFNDYWINKFNNK